MLIRSTLIAAVVVAGTLVAGCSSDDDTSSAPQPNLPVEELPILRVEDFPQGFEPDASATPEAEDDDANVEPAECNMVDGTLDAFNDKAAHVDMKNNADDVSMEFKIAQVTPDEFAIETFEPMLEKCSSMTLTADQVSGAVTLSPHSIDIPDAESTARRIATDFTAGGVRGYATGYIVYATVDGFVMYATMDVSGIGEAPADQASGENIPFTTEFFDLVDKQIDYIKNAG